jgi:uncharacterized membrane protein
MILNYEYVTNETTKIEIEVPLTLPGLGATKVPVSVSAPQIAGKGTFFEEPHSIQLAPL